MSTIVLVEQKVPDKKLNRETIFKYHPNPEMREQIINDIEKNAKIEIKDDMVIEFNFRVSLKEYDFSFKPTDKNQCYQEYSNTKTVG